MLKASINTLTGTSKASISKFNKINLHTIEDLVEHYPKNYEDRSIVVAINQVVLNQANNIVAKVISVPIVNQATKLKVLRFQVSDNTGIMNIVFYRMPYLVNHFQLGHYYNFYGVVKLGLSLEMSSPSHQTHEKYQSSGKLFPIYPSTATLSQGVIRKYIWTSLNEFIIPSYDIAKINDTNLLASGDSKDEFLANDDSKDELMDIAYFNFVPPQIEVKHNLVSKQYALCNIHFPKSAEDLTKARKRLIFEELFLLQMGLYFSKSDFKTKKKGSSKILPDEYNKFVTSLPFVLTNAQQRVVDDLIKDLKSTSAANRLIQGDVGSGKTLVAAIALFIAVKNGYQASMMAPTEVLARQHFDYLSALFKDFNINIDILTGSISKKKREALLENLKNGDIDILIGTHALLEDCVVYKNLGVVITDEQHRFGVRQRLTLNKKGHSPDVIVMTATPIPRTLALILYGDMDISLIDELPPGRIPIQTYAVPSRYHARIYKFMREHIDAGKQCYIICPMVEENEKMDNLKDVISYSEQLKGVFSGYTLEYLHGKMKPKEKNQIIENFVCGKTNILISTTVIEVGINVPNATIMLIENAERFGLSQLHQLRGRVGRGTDASHCILVSDSTNDNTIERLKIMSETTDGFKIADTDLKLRGSGELFGTRQHGLPNMKIANMYTDTSILKIAQEEATAIFKSKKLQKEYQYLINIIKEKFNAENSIL
ncbi:MAG: ATP-dependent DNA helicase RecG [Candidatus Epulonipiscioides saccharophilum]|nr:MAG: ATP-dependent DNA helicase RecG [Epulopiscium sp. AS2M-Bin001]